MKTIIVSALVLNGSRSGYRRIIRNILLHSLRSSFELRYVFLFQKSGFISLGINECELPECIAIRIYPDFINKWIRGLVEQIAVPYEAIIRNASAIFMPATFGLLLPVKPVLTFVHTNTTFMMPNIMRGRGTAQQWAHLLLARITSITSTEICYTSNQTRSEYSTYFKVKNSGSVLGNGLMPFQSSSKPGNFFLKSRSYILSVSQIYRVKNHDSLIKAFVSFKNSNSNRALSDLCLLIVGSVQEYDYFEELKSLVSGRNDVFFMSNVPDDQLEYIYLNALCYCLFSFFEGYSLTPGEALLAGLPVAISDIKTHREIYSDYAVYADPSSLSSIERAIARVVTSSSKSYSVYTSAIAQKLSFETFFNRLEGLLKAISS